MKEKEINGNRIKKESERWAGRKTKNEILT